MNQLAVLQVVLPLVAAPGALLFRRGAGAWSVAFAVSACAALISVLLLRQVASGGEIVATLGGWPAPWGIEYRIDAVNAYVLPIVSVINALVMLYARQSVAAEVEDARQPLFYATWLLCLCGLLGILATGDAFNLFVFLEISSLSSYALIAMGRERRALTASFQYLIMGTIGATFILIGVGFLYISTGTLNMADLAARVATLEHTRTVQAAFAFMVVGIGLKMAMFPLHLWLPNAYAYAPSAVSAFLAATATKVAVYMLIRFFFTVFGAGFVFDSLPLPPILLALAVAAVLVASTVAVFQDNLKRMLAYSSVAQVGYILLGLSLGSRAGLGAAILHVFNHALIKGGLFLALGCIAFRVGSVNLASLSGVSRRMPWTCAAFVVGGLSLIGVPPTTGFASKWMLVTAALERGWWPVAVVVLLGSLVAVMYVWRVFEVVYAKGAAEGARDEAPWSLLLPTWLLIGAGVWFGIRTETSIGLAESAAAWLMGGGP